MYLAECWHYSIIGFICYTQKLKVCTVANFAISIVTIIIKVKTDLFFSKKFKISVVSFVLIYFFYPDKGLYPVGIENLNFTN